MSDHIEKIMANSEQRSLLRISTAGSVDDGKSTLIGRLLHDSKTIYEDHLESIRGKSKLNGDIEIDFSLLTDGLRAEREQGITIDVAYRYFSTPKRHFILADTPGHVQYTRNMATGASTSALAILLIDARHGVSEQTKRHAFISALLGVPRIVVTVNKMDLIDWDERAYLKIKADFHKFAKKLGIKDITFIPVSALKGDNIVNRSENLPWYKGSPLLAHLEEVYVDSDTNMVDFRFPVQYVIRPNQYFRGFAGKIVSGAVRVGDDIIVLPSKKTAKIKSIETFEGSVDSSFAPHSVTLTLSEELDVSRGDMIVRINNIPDVKSDFEAILIWMDDHKAANTSSTYIMLHGNREVKCKVNAFRYRIDVNDLSRMPNNSLSLNEIGRVNLESLVPLFLDDYHSNRATGNFVLVDELTNSTVAAGMVLARHTVNDLVQPEIIEKNERAQSHNNIFAEKYGISADKRRDRSGHEPLTIWFTGLSGSGKSTLGRELERLLFNQKAQCYLLDGDNLRAGLNGDLEFSEDDRSENIRRVAEVARLFNNAGNIAVCTLISPLEKNRESARKIVGKSNFVEIYVSTPLDECEKRDVKGLYHKARSGNLPFFTGIDSPYEQPLSADLTVSTVSDSIENCSRKIFEFVRDRIWPAGK